MSNNFLFKKIKGVQTPYPSRHLTDATFRYTNRNTNDINPNDSKPNDINRNDTYLNATLTQTTSTRTT